MRPGTQYTIDPVSMSQKRSIHRGDRTVSHTATVVKVERVVNRDVLGGPRLVGADKKRIHVDCSCGAKWAWEKG